MVLSRSPQKVERLTVTLIPEHDEMVPFHVPSTFNVNERSYGWRRSSRMDYMIVPTRVSSSEIKIDVFVTPARGERIQAKHLVKVVQDFIQAKLSSEWRGLRLAEVGRPPTVAPPRKLFVRGTIEEMLGTTLDS